ncbi:bifunctional (p)ppGpp synthetase/guanosine-3',5'-bis(diphosphate) 3'-pyrophosphohydrolase [Oceanivirga salmonicida]|uniref:bifunctional (p)ppGpp synthetase/guanosine-3',5'-bis(diphosphate) 3'-pyrophosphohydrolase n=1 Tax=Oceanivirga salmonicida TaxID=1769291 RepID=UPI0012E20858|nr:bifunctional (p)ppGpp synthetase/guanosine-3',5'-bis(diphosphate) 3'-pyrophosphohydrolase [Oceanivirga salmonicida]
MKFIKALIIAIKAHKGQVDKAGRAYIFHPINVMLGVSGYKEKVVALLHDTVEDSNYTLDDLRKYFTEEIVHTVDLLTKKEGVEYKEYLRLIKENKIARKVKISDLRHNMNLKRLKEVTQKDLDRLEKYKWSKEYLESKKNS